ncbi:MAG: L-rhamnose mutarotase [Bacteroidota bacterium]
METQTGYIVPAKETKTKRYCMTLDLKDDPELIKEYKYWHENENIWPEIPEGIKEVGIVNMEIYLYGTRMFMIMETALDFDFEKDMARLGTLERQAEWEKFVGKFQKSLPGAPEGSKWQLMDRVYKLE